MLRTYREAICWLSHHEAAVLVITATHARLVDAHQHADGLHLKAAAAILQNERRMRWFVLETSGDRKLLRLNDAGARYHEQLIARRQCRCPIKRTATAIKAAA
jgi:hypothetical protein